MKIFKKVKIDPISYSSIPVEMVFSKTNQTLATGTAFIYESNNKNYLITNWHNVTGLNPLTMEALGNHGGVPDLLCFKLQTQKEPSIKWETFKISLYDNENRAVWLVHPNLRERVDVIAIQIPEDVIGIIRPINKIRFDEFELRVSDEVFVLGFPYSITGGGALPIWKRGSIASEPDIDYENLPKFYIDTASRPGMSGSPVIFRRFGINGTEDGVLRISSTIGEIRGFVGIYSGRITGTSQFEAQLGVVWKKEVIEQIIDGKLRDSKTF